MSKIEAVTGKAHLSYSSLYSYLSCGERFRLERVVGVQQTPAWWFIGGTAFHAATELIDRGQERDPYQAWNRAFMQAISDDVPEGFDWRNIRVSGRASKQWPNKENHDWWQANGPTMVSDYLAWKSAAASMGGWELLVLDGEPAIEVQFDMDLGGTKVRGFVDRVFVNRNGEVIVVDLKTGTRVPEDTLQLGTYAAGLEASTGVRPSLGCYYMARKGQVSDMVSMTRFTNTLLEAWYGQARWAIEHEVFIPKVTGMCHTCGVAAHCYAYTGEAPAGNLDLEKVAEAVKAGT